ncbi:hypothetical protein Q2T42_24220 [Leptolyngbya boryana CZ1]|uniref:Uncharacterized protein n=1 Tax=Leptolyngbya boryana CZ1 TaxID=3060204 RepID=A0AA97ASJ9_LEPBY|nr:hypothetical protein [Leptolyngbya boryana]WNZ44905.1 hypothetical protein Q2T42_24220 [Leptolyngbya boryana CZ1]
MSQDSNQTPESQSSVAQSQTTDFISSLKTGTIKLLRSTIQFLEKTANTLEGSSEPNPTVAKILKFFSVVWEKFLPIWNQLLKLVRDRLSPEWNEKLGDRALSGILAGAIVILFWFTTSLFSSKPPQPQVANRSPLILPDQTKSSFPSDLSTPDTAPQTVTTPVVSEPEVVSEPIVVSEPEVVSEPIVVGEPEVVGEPIVVSEPIVVGEPEAVSEPEVVAEIPVEAAEPIVETPEVEVPEVVAEPAIPQPELTPEEKRIAAIEDQVIEISDRFINGLVVSVEQNETRGQMKVTVSNDWYRFNAEQQDRFADELWTRSQTFKLPKLEVRDPRGVLLARPPIVGDSMVVVKRKSAIAS